MAETNITPPPVPRSFPATNPALRLKPQRRVSPSEWLPSPELLALADETIVATRHGSAVVALPEGVEPAQLREVLFARAAAAGVTISTMPRMREGGFVVWRPE